MNSKLETLRKDRCRGSVSSSFEKFIYIPCRGIKGEELGCVGCDRFRKKTKKNYCFSRVWGDKIARTTGASLTMRRGRRKNVKHYT